MRAVDYLMKQREAARVLRNVGMKGMIDRRPDYAFIQGADAAKGHCYVMRPDICKVTLSAANALSEIPPIYREMVPCRAAVVWLEEPWQVSGRLSSVAAISWSVEPKCFLGEMGQPCGNQNDGAGLLLIGKWGRSAEVDAVPTTLSFIHFATAIPPDDITPVPMNGVNVGDEVLTGGAITHSHEGTPAKEESGKLLGQIYTFFHFLQEGPVEVQQPPRHERRAIGMKGSEEPSPISVITLRHPKREYDDEVEPVDWQHRWIVNGHWRQQWYPSLGVNLPKWIHAYVKGPEDKPLVVKEKVYVVAR